MSADTVFPQDRGAPVAAQQGEAFTYSFRAFLSAGLAAHSASSGCVGAVQRCLIGA